MINRAQLLVPSSKAALAEAIACLPSGDAGYFRAVLWAMLEHDVQVAIVPQNSGPFSFTFDRPTVVIIQDDPGKSLGPEAFDAKSVLSVLDVALGVVLVLGKPIEEPYHDAAGNAHLCTGSVLLIETRERHEGDWSAFVWGNRPRLPILLYAPPRQGMLQ